MAQQRQLDRLLEIAGRHNKLIKKEVIIDGEDFSFWHKPMTIEQYTEAKAAAGTDDVLDTSIHLFVEKALDKSGNRQYQADAIPVLKKVLPFEFATALLNALQNSTKPEGELDMKSPEKSAKEGEHASS